MKKTLKKIWGWKPKTLIETLALEAVKIGVVLLMAAALTVGFKWALVHDQTNVKANESLVQKAKEFDARLKFQKAHPRVDVFE